MGGQQEAERHAALLLRQHVPRSPAPRSRHRLRRRRLPRQPGPGAGATRTGAARTRTRAIRCSPRRWTGRRPADQPTRHATTRTSSRSRRACPAPRRCTSRRGPAVRQLRRRQRRLVGLPRVHPRPHGAADHGRRRDTGALGRAQAGAIGEGWSDFYALDYLEEGGLEVDALGTSTCRRQYLDNRDGAASASGDRLRPQIDCQRPPGGGVGAGAGSPTATSPDRREGPEGARQRRDLGADAVGPARARSVPPATRRAHRHRAMRLSPPEPSFLDMRNAILQASSDERR